MARVYLAHMKKDDLKNRNFDKTWMYWDCC